MRYFTFFFLVLFCSALSYSQVGINATAIHSSAALDIQSNTKGLLTPRMTTVQRTGIDSPADGLIVYDTDLKSFYHYKTGSPGVWVRMSSEATGRTNFKRIKSISDLAAEKVGTTYVLNTNTYYEVNGAIEVDFPIDLNNAYLVGLDANEDKLVNKSTLALFTGASGGTVKNLSLLGTETNNARAGTLFNLDGATTQNLLLRDCIVQQFASVGTIKGFGLVFSSVVQYVGNGGGITYDTITRLLLSNIGWFGNNSGIFEKYTGTFNLIQKLGGFMDLTSGTFGIDVGTNPTIEGDAVVESVVFTGDPVTGVKYVNKYTTGSYTNFNFTNQWTVNSSGIPREGDAVATGDINLDVAVGYGVATQFTGTGSASRKKIFGTTTSNNLYRFTKDGDNKIIYSGNKLRFFQVAASVSYQGEADLGIILYIAKNGVVLTQTKVYGKGTSGKTATASILALPIVGTVQLRKDDYIEIWAERFTGTTDMATVSLNLTIR